MRKMDLRPEAKARETRGKRAFVSPGQAHVHLRLQRNTEHDDSPDEDQHGRQRDGGQHDLGALLSFRRELSWLGQLVVRRGRRGRPSAAEAVERAPLSDGRVAEVVGDEVNEDEGEGGHDDHLDDDTADDAENRWEDRGRNVSLVGGLEEIESWANLSSHSGCKIYKSRTKESVNLSLPLGRRVALLLTSFVCLGVGGAGRGDPTSDSLDHERDDVASDEDGL